MIYVGPGPIRIEESGDYELNFLSDYPAYIRLADGINVKLKGNSPTSRLFVIGSHLSDVETSGIHKVYVDSQTLRSLAVGVAGLVSVYVKSHTRIFLRGAHLNTLDLNSTPGSNIFLKGRIREVHADRLSTEPHVFNCSGPCLIEDMRTVHYSSTKELTILYGVGCQKS